MKKSPLLGIRFYQNGDLLDIGGDTGGNAARSYNKKEAFKYMIRIKYKKVRNFWYAKSEKNRNEEYENLYLPEFNIYRGTSISTLYVPMSLNTSSMPFLNL